VCTLEKKDNYDKKKNVSKTKYHHQTINVKPH
jgi:hypothetical protein